MHKRKYDIVLFGATGFAGQLTAKYLAGLAVKEKLTFAIAGRSSAKLEILTQELKQETGINVDYILADLQDGQSLEIMCRNTQIIMNAVGPYVLYGESVLKACIQTKTHYLDITGEQDFVLRMRHLYSKAIEHAQISCVHCCGFDSVPADLGTFLNVGNLPHADAKSMQVYVSTNATFSSGTIRSAVLAISGKYSFRKGRKPLNKRTGKLPIKRSIHYNRTLKKWCMPMPVIDAYIVQESANAFPELYGKHFAYAQYFTFPTFFSMAKILGILLIGSFFLRFGIFQNIVFNRFKSGQGPSFKKRSKSTFRLDFFGQSGESTLHSAISGGDPGYDETAKMFSECAFCMVQQINEGNLIAGSQSPVSAWGNILFNRLKMAGILFKSPV